MTCKQICQLGFKCPYHNYGEYGDEICTHPYIRITEREDKELFDFPDEMNCPLLTWDSPLDKWRMGYEVGE